jgi:hypothetical protein
MKELKEPEKVARRAVKELKDKENVTRRGLRERAKKDPKSHEAPLKAILR